MRSLWHHISFHPNLSVLMILLCCLLGVVCAALATLLWMHLMEKKPTPQTEPGGEQKAEECLKARIPEKSPLSVGSWITWLRERRWVHSGPLHRTMIKLFKEMRRNAFSRLHDHRLPWYVMVGGEGETQDVLLKTLRTFQEPALPYVVQDERLHGFLYHQALIWGWSMSTDPPQDQPWFTFLDLLKTYRPRRPLDGVVLVLPAPLLEAAQVEERQRWMLRAYKTLWTLQKSLGMRLPVHMVVCHSQTMPGFSALTRHWIEHQQDLWGWSHPYEVDQPYDPTWADEFMHTMLERLYALSVSDVAMKDPACTQALLELSSCWRHHTPVWQELLNDLFKPSSLHHPFMLRSISFTGLNEEGQTPSETAPLFVEGLNPYAEAPLLERPSLPLLHRMWGVRDLFERKIFPEALLARPLKDVVYQRTRSIHWMWGWMGASALIAAVGTCISLYRLQSSVHSVMPALGHIQKTTEGLRLMHTRPHEDYNPLCSGSTKRACLEHQGAVLLHLIQQADLTGFYTLFLPTTWFSSCRNQVEMVLTQGYDTMVMGGRGLELVHALHVLMQQPYWPLAREPQVVSNPLESPQFQNLLGYVRALKSLEDEVTLYNRYQRGDLNDHLQTVLRLLRDQSSSWRKWDHINAKRHKAHMIHLETHQKTCQSHVAALYQEFMKSVFTTAPLKSTTELWVILEKLQETLHHPEQQGSWNQLVETTHALSYELSSLEKASLSWLKEQRFAPGSDYDRMMALMGQIHILGEEFAKGLIQKADQDFVLLKKDLQDQDVPFVGHVLEVKDQNLTSLPSPQLISMRQNLEDFLKLPFFSAVEEQTLGLSRLQGPGRIWDEAILQEMMQRLEQFETFQKKVLPTYHPLIQKNVLDLGRRRLQRLMRSLLASAHVPIPHALDTQNGEENLRLQIESFQKNLSTLLKIMGFMSTPERSPEWGAIRQYVREYAVLLAKKTHHLFQEDRLYEVGKNPFREWMGEGNPALIAFHAPDAEELKYLLGIHRDRASYWAHFYMEPLMQILGHKDLRPSAAEEAFLGQWPKIIAQVQAAEKKMPGQSIGAFEHFVISQTGLITLKNCAAQTQAALSPSSDYFAQKLNHMVRSLQDRCASLTWDQAKERYETLSAFFNENLAGRVPFVEPARIRVDTKDAAWSDIRTLCALYADAQILLKAHEELLGLKATQFIKQLEHLVAFFKPFVDHIPEDGDPASFDLAVQVELKYWPDYGQGLSSVSGWTWQSGATPVTLYSPDPKTHWHIGQPVRLGLEWAHSGPCVPYDPGQKGSLEMTPPYEAAYTYQGVWGLLRMMLIHQAMSQHTQGKVTPPAGILAFSFPTRPKNPDTDGEESAKPASKVLKPAAGQAACPTVIGFAKVMMSVPSKDKPLPLKIPVFPLKAPQLPQEPSVFKGEGRKGHEDD